MPAQRSFERAADSGDVAFAKALARLWPHRLHESNWLKNVFCFFGLHSWRKLSLEELLPEKREVRFCFWCDKVKLDGVIHGD
jgi:hypothetical protein